MNLVTVRWTDAYSIDEWRDIDEYALEPDGSPCETTGYLIRESKKALFVAGSVGTDNTACCVMVIPKEFVKEVTRWPKKK